MQITLGQCLLLHRTKRGLTHKELGNRVFPELQAPHQKIKKIESGVYDPKPAELKKLAKHLDVSVAALMDTTIEAGQKDDRLYLDDRLLDFFPELENTVDILNNLAKMERKEFALKMILQVLEEAVRDINARLEEFETEPQENTGNKVASAR